MAPSTYPKPLAARRAKAVVKTQALLGGQGTCRMYGFGVTGPDPQRSLLWMIGGAVGFCVVLAVLTGIILFPGLLGIAVARWVINTPRVVAVADEGIVVTKESPVDARPREILGRFPLDQIFVVIAKTTSHVCLQLGAERVWLRRKEHDILVSAAQTARPQT
ncbi:MAG TPA: hypothetical protein VK771_03800, partial [Acidimicrobiia bacterium]|nr:hypothetical protein [Acidimicrobiia bacterium]